MSVFLPTLLNWLLAYGYPILWLSVFLSSAGLPIPTPLTLLAAGAFAEAGDFNVFLLAALAITASVGGDSTGYFIGKRWGSKALDWLEKSKWNRFISAKTIARSRARFQRQAGWAVFLTRFLFPALGGVVNLLAGADLFPYRYFLRYDIAGEILSAVIPLSLGYAFSASWEAVGDVLGSFSLFALALLVAIFLVIYLVRMVQRSKERTAGQDDEPLAIPGQYAKAPAAAERPERTSGNLPLS